MPLLTVDTHLGIFGVKFTREDGTIVYSDNPLMSHADIAKAEGIGKPIQPQEGDFRRELDDAGFMGQGEDESLVFSGSSITCKLRDPKNARTETLEVAFRLTGKPAKESAY